MDIRVQKILEQIKELSKQTFKENLTGVYVHGSVALGCFNWNNSDIDFIVVLKNIPTEEQKEKYITGLLEINNECPAKGLEMSIVLEKYTHQFVYPTPFELHFSNAHLKRCSDDLREYCRHMNGTDKDLAAHFTIINNAGITLCGKQIKDTFGEVPKDIYFDSIQHDIEDAEDEVLKNPIYIILNLCRVLAYKCDGLILSKKGGGAWGIKHFDRNYCGIIEKALSSYQDAVPFPVEENKNIMVAFARQAVSLIFAK